MQKYFITSKKNNSYVHFCPLHHIPDFLTVHWIIFINTSFGICNVIRSEGTYYTFPYLADASQLVIRSSQFTQQNENLLRLHSVS